MSRKRPVEERFWEKVNRVDAACWEWLACRRKQDGYAVFRYGREQLAHRVSVILAGVTIPPGMEVDHTCFNRACVRPDHLRVVDQVAHRQQAGIRATAALRARCAKQTKCVHGHEYTPENTYRCPRGKRQCRICMKASARKVRSAETPERRAARLAYLVRWKKARVGRTLDRPPGE